MKVRIVSVGDLAPFTNGDGYIANLIVLVEGQSSLMTVKVVVPNDKVSLIREGSLLDIVPTSKSTFSVRRYESDNGKAEELATKIDEILKGVKK